jgi:hypothetical protein
MRTHIPPAYQTWKGMKQRCDNPNADNYADYGGRGITYDPRWIDFNVFLGDMGDRPKGMTLDRIDCNGNYTRENCRWADKLTQDNNRNSTRWLEFKGETLSVTQWAVRLGVHVKTLNSRLNYLGWSVERTLTTPTRNLRKAA